MKKFCNKLTKQQWRVTVPNISTSIFRKSPTKEEATKDVSSEKVSARSSGFYDLEEAQLEYDRTRSLPNSVYMDIENITTDSESDKFEDARAMSEKNSDIELNKEAPENETDFHVYADVDISHHIESTNVDKANSQFEYDVPKISFSFFGEDKNEEDNYKSLGSENENTSDQENYENINIIQNTVKSEVRIVLESQKIEDNSGPKFTSTPTKIKKFVTHADIELKCNEAEPIAIIKCGSDPNLIPKDDGEQNEDDCFYKIPRSLKKPHRLSQSLNDFNPEAVDTITSKHSSLEHISCSQIISLRQNIKDQSIETNAQPTQESMDYCKTRSKLPLRVRRPTFLKSPKKAVVKWNNFRTKFNNLMAEHAAQQRVGAFDDREKVTLNLEEMYKNSKTKCKKVLENTGKIFYKNRKMSNDCDSGNSSPIVKNEAFFNKVELKASDIEYKFNVSDNSVPKEDSKIEDSLNDSKLCNDFSKSVESEKPKEEFDFASIKSAFKRSKLTLCEGQNGFEDLRRYVKQGGDFCKELSTILQERAEAETQYAKSLSKLSAKLARACREGVGGLNEAWKAVALELEARSEGHRILGAALLDETAKPLRTLTESQHRTRKHSEAAVDKAARLLTDWRAAEAKGKKHSHTCARDNEKLQDASVLDTSRLSRSTSLIQLAQNMHNKTTTDKENAKIEGKKKKAEDAVKKADIEYYTLCVRTERARLEWESAVLRGVISFQTLEEERLNNLKSVLTSYLNHNIELGPRLLETTERLRGPVSQAEPPKDLSTLINLRQSSQQVSEQLLPDFYCEHITLAMNRERRKQALVKLLQLIRQDIDRERKSKNGLQNLSKAIKQTPNFGAEDSQQNVTEKLYHMKSMLTYLEGARYKLQSVLAELDSRPKSGHPLAAHITITRDKSGLQQSILRVPQWLREEYFDGDKSPVSEKSAKSVQSDKSDNSDPHINDVDDPDWTDRGAADGNSNQPDSDFDEFSSQCSSTGNICNTEEHPVQPIAKCKALYIYTPNLTDELALRPGDILSVYRQQDDGWWLGECNGNVGIFPATYVETIPS